MILFRKSMRCLHQCSRHVNSFSGNLDGSVGGLGQSRKHFDEIQPDHKKLLNNEQFLVSSGNEFGFKINQQVVLGPVLVLPSMGFLHWQCNNIQKASADSLFLLSRIYPKIELLLVGCGEIIEQAPLEFKKACKTHGIGLHIESTQQAIQTYGIFLEDNRNFAALLIPASLQLLPDVEKIYLQKKKRQQNLRSLVK